MLLKFQALLAFAFLYQGIRVKAQDSPPFWLNEVYIDDERTGDAVEFVCKSGEPLGRVAFQVYYTLGNTATTATIWPGSRTNPNFVCPDSTTGFFRGGVGLSSIRNIDGPIAICTFSATTGNTFQFIGFGLHGTATGGRCTGMTTSDSGVTDTELGLFARLTGDGCSYKDFSWTSGQTNTNIGSIPNVGQTFSCDDNSQVPVGADGDPHFLDWHGDWWDYHGKCDMVLVDAPSFAGGLGLTAQIR